LPNNENCEILECEYFYPSKMSWYSHEKDSELRIWMSGKTKGGIKLGIWNTYSVDGKIISTVNHDIRPN